MSDRTNLPSKRDLARALLLRGSVMVHLDPRRQAVRVPPWLRSQAQLVLQIGLDLPVPIPDLRVDAYGVCGTLSFNRAPFRCDVPWEAVFALMGEDGRGMVWPESLPPEIDAEIQREAERSLSPELRGQPEPGSRPPDSAQGQAERQPGAAPDAARAVGFHGSPGETPTLGSDESGGPRNGGGGEDRELTAQAAVQMLPVRVRGSGRSSPPRRRASGRPHARARSLPPYLKVVK